jgi:hypothetical protein
MLYNIFKKFLIENKFQEKKVRKNSNYLANLGLNERVFSLVCFFLGALITASSGTNAFGTFGGRPLLGGTT